jgi:hypothetical protein
VLPPTVTYCHDFVTVLHLVCWWCLVCLHLRCSYHFTVRFVTLRFYCYRFRPWVILRLRFWVTVVLVFVPFCSTTAGVQISHHYLHTPTYVHSYTVHSTWVLFCSVLVSAFSWYYLGGPVHRLFHSFLHFYILPFYTFILGLVFLGLPPPLPILFLHLPFCSFLFIPTCTPPGLLGTIPVLLPTTTGLS